MVRCALLAALLSACGDKAIDLAFQLPPDALDTSCATTVELFTNGKNYPMDPNDYNDFVVDIDPSATLPDVEKAMRGKLDVPIPPSGLASLEFYAWAGDSGFADNVDTGVLLFSSYAAYVGQDTMELPILANLSCKRSTILVRPLDLIKYIAPLSTATPPPPDCPAAAVDATSTIELGSLTPSLYQDGLLFWGTTARTQLVTGGASITGLTTPGPQTCTATRTFFGAAKSATISCANYSTGACGKANELELPVIDPAYVDPSVDADLIGQFLGMTVGVVLKPGTGGNLPVAGATVTVDPALGTVVYVDSIDTTNHKLVPKKNATATTTTGMFIVYGSALIQAKVTAGATTKMLTLGAEPIDEYSNASVPGAVTVLVN